ncbi:Plant specific Rop nucleotide exchanger, PRONE [Cynara cardunculus var. scolymus]|uniref:Plant specific Rop nucleotide exchanger, PRONE n=1 Tax=Cynara cardunculus var. scolymus TaxID=59895 RepID=A0A103XFK3_CYNCS|nr:Plant specific Rop nucleotide exchanger, PRONE [Cynara cardunculus var. scolymus]
MTYNGLESCILNANSCEDESVASRGDECPTDSLDEDGSSCSSSNNASGSFSSQWTMMKRDEHEWEYSESSRQSIANEEPSCAVQISDMKIMKEKFAKLLLGEDSTGGRKEDRKNKWRREMEWLLAPTNYMVELVPAKQYGANGRTLEASSISLIPTRTRTKFRYFSLNELKGFLIMRPKAREDETLDAMTITEFWYEEGGCQAEGRIKSVKQSKRWWLPTPRVPVGGLSDGERKKLLNQAKLVHQIFKAAKSINEAILLEMPIPTIIGEALPKASLGDDLYRMLNTISSSAVGMLNLLNLKSEHSALDTVNRLEAAIYAWKERISERTCTKSPARTSWSLKDPSMELDKMEFLINRAEVLLQQIRVRYPNLPQTFLDVMKIQYGKDIAHAILEAYSRVLGNVAFGILSRIGDISQEDVSSDPNSPMAANSLPGVNLSGISGISVSNISTRHTLIDKMNNIEGKLGLLKAEKASYTAFLSDEPNSNSVTGTPSRSPRCCMGKEVCFTPPKMSP